MSHRCCSLQREIMDKMHEGSQNLMGTESQDKMVQGDSPDGPSTHSHHHSMKDVVIRILDEMEQRVEKLRCDALSVEAEKDDILSTFDSIVNAELFTKLEGIERDEIDRYAERLHRRTLAVQVQVMEERTQSQLESIHKVNNMIDALITEAKDDAAESQRKCIAYLNACSDHVSTNVDPKFENAVLGCSVEDQKRIKKRLSGLYSYFRQTLSVLEERDEETGESIAMEHGLKGN